MNTSKHTPKKPKELDLRYAKPEAQAYVREQAIRLHHEGWTNVDIAKHFNVHQNTVGKWIKRARTDGVEGAIKVLHDILKYPPNDIKFDPPEGGVERYFYNDEKVEDHGFRCSSQRRFQNHDYQRMPSSCAATCS